MGEGANRFANSLALEKIDLKEFHTPYQLHWFNKLNSFTAAAAPWTKGTVGAVVRDAEGYNSGRYVNWRYDLRKLQGRVGDSPIIGAGTYADSRIGGVSCSTGYGEQIACARF
jgi:beta-aspartyl-peptidase (threonine type)